MDPNLNRMSMGSRAGTSIKPKFGAQQGAVSRQGTAIKVFIYFKNKGIKPIGRCWRNSLSKRTSINNRRRYKWTTRCINSKKSLR